MKTKFTKVAVEERLPEEIDTNTVFLTKEGNVRIFYNKKYLKDYEPNYEEDELEYFLEESPDREDEIMDMLEGIRNDIRIFEKEANQVAENFENSEMINSAMCSKAMARAYNTCNTKIDSLLQTLKQNK